MKSPHLSVSGLLRSDPADPAAPADDDADVSCGRFADVELLGVDGRLQRLHTDHVLQLQVSRRGFTRAELLDELPEAEADPLPGHKVLVLDVRSHVLREERLIAANKHRVQFGLYGRRVKGHGGTHLLWL